jgi:hypothetical protein
MPVARFPRDVRAPRAPEPDCRLKVADERPETADALENPERVARAEPVAVDLVPATFVTDGRMTRRELLVQGAAALEERVAPRLERPGDRNVPRVEVPVEVAEAPRPKVPCEPEREIPPARIRLADSLLPRPLWRTGTAVRPSDDRCLEKPREAAEALLEREEPRSDELCGDGLCRTPPKEREVRPEPARLDADGPATEGLERITRL